MAGQGPGEIRCPGGGFFGPGAVLLGLVGPAGALGLARRANEATTESIPSFLVTLAQAQLAVGDETAARETAERALELLPPDERERTSLEDLLARDAGS